MRRGVSNASHRCRTNQGIDERRKPKPSPPCRENRRETKHNKRVAVRQKRALHYVAVETCGFFRRFRRLHYRKKEFLINNFHQNKPFIRLFYMFNCRFFQYDFKHNNKKGLRLQSFLLLVYCLFCPIVLGFYCIFIVFSKTYPQSGIYVVFGIRFCPVV